MVRKRNLEEIPPKGGWLGPPNTRGLAATHVKDKKGKWVPAKLSDKQRKKHKKFQKAMKKADKQDQWRF